MNTNANTEIDPRLKEVVCFVEATSFEELTLWENHNQVLWEQDNIGWLKRVGTIDDRPINVYFRFVKINKKMICFYEAISSAVDHTLISNFLSDNCPQASHTQAMNFYIALDHVSDLNVFQTKAVVNF